MKEIDQTVINAFMNCIKGLIVDGELPIPDSNVLDKMKQCGEFDLKTTTFKKFSVFLKRMQQENLIETKQIVNGPFVLTSIRRDHPDYVDFVLQETEIKKKKSANDFSDEKYKNSKVTAGAVTVIIMYKPPNRLEPIFEGEPINALYTMSEAQKRLWEWCGNNKMLDPRGKKIIVKEDLWKVVLKPKKSKEKEIPRNLLGQRLSRKKVAKEFGSWMMKHHAIQAPGVKLKWRAGSLTKIGVYIEKRQGGKKNTTIVWNLELYGIDLKEFSKVAQKAFAASTSISDLPGKQRKDQHMIKIQGSVAPKVVELLGDPELFNIPDKFVEETLKRPY